MPRRFLSVFLPIFGVLACTAAGLGWSLSSAGCSISIDENSLDAGDGDGDGGDTGAAKVTICPVDVPQEGATCTQPDGTTCVLGACNNVYSTCNSGIWHLAPNRPVPFVCPEFLPKPAESCPKCWPDTIACAYGCDPDGGAVARRATCSAVSKGSWAWQIADHACPVSDGGLDAGSDASASDAADAAHD